MNRDRPAELLQSLGMKWRCLDYREKAQVGALLAAVQMSAASAFQQFPAISAVYLAETAMVLLQPDGPLYSSINKLLTRTPRLKLQVSTSTPFPEGLA